MNGVSVVRELAEMNNLILKVLSARYKELNLKVTPVQSRIIMFIYNSKEKVCQKELEKFIGCSKSTLSSILSTMEKNGYIERKGSMEDFRRNNICLTNVANKVVTVLQKDNKIIDKIMMKDITEEEMQSFISFTQKIKKNLERI